MGLYGENRARKQPIIIVCNQAVRVIDWYNGGERIDNSRSHTSMQHARFLYAMWHRNTENVDADSL